MIAVHLLTIVFIVTLLWVAIVDVKHYVIPNKASIGLILFAILLPEAILNLEIENRLWGIALGFTLVLTSNGIFKIWKGADGIGMGDAKLLAAFGGLLGVYYLPFILLIGSSLGILFFIINHKFHFISLSTGRIPFGPFLSLGFLLCWLQVHYFVL